MRRLFNLILQNQGLLVFLLLEIFCYRLIVRNNIYQNAAYFNSSNTVTGSILSVTSSINQYFSLRSQNEIIAGENAILRDKLSSYEQIKNLHLQRLLSDTTISHFEYIPAKVINNAYNRDNNYITINIGQEHGVKPGMGVVGSDGIVGQVIACSKHYSTVISLLHNDMSVSSHLENTKTLATTKWTTNDYKYASLMYVPPHATVGIGEKVVTSGYNTVFPEGITIGKVESVAIDPRDSFYRINVALATDFSKLYFVYVVKNNIKKELQEIEQAD